MPRRREAASGRPARVSAHSADFVWRAAGAIATVVEAAATAHVVSLSYGERGESGELWKQEGQTTRSVKEIRHGEAPRPRRRWAPSSAASTSATTRSGRSDAPRRALIDLIRELEPE